MQTLRLVGNSTLDDFGHLQIVFDESVEIEVHPSSSPFNPVGNPVWQFRINSPLVVAGEAFEAQWSSPIDLGGRDTEDVWMMLVRAAQQIRDAGPISYDLTNQNSNTFINTLLYTAGISAAQWSFDHSFSYPGVEYNIIDQVTFNISGTSSDDWFFAGAKNDILSGGQGDDYLSGAGGNDEISGGTGNDELLGGGDNDSIYGGIGNDYVQGDDGNDIIDGGDGDDNLSGGLGEDRIKGEEGVDQIWGGEGHDVLEGGADDDELFGDAGNDTLDGGAGADKLNGGSGDDTLEGGAGVDLISGGEGRDELTGGADNDELIGEAGNDGLVGGEGADVLNGGDGVDTASYASSSKGVNVNLLTGTGTLGDAEGDTLIDIENLTGSDYRDILTGDAKANKLIGGDGDDVLIGGDGIDALYGGTGSDLLVVGTLQDSGVKSLRAGTEIADGGAGADYILLSDASSNHITVKGGDKNDHLLVMPHFAGRAVGADGSLHALALVGGVETVALMKIHNPPSLQVSGPQNVFTYVIKENESGVTYSWDKSAKKLHVTIFYLDGAGVEKTFEVTIENFNNGDYGITLSTFITEYIDIYVDNSRANTHRLDGDALAAAKKLEAELRTEADSYRVTPDLRVVPTGRMALNDDAANTELSPTQLIFERTASVGEQSYSGTDLRERFTMLEGDDVVRAGGGNDLIDGGDGADQLHGQDGDDDIIGGGGNDRLIGGAGADYLDGGDGVDTADYRTSDAAVSVDLLDFTASGGDAEGDFIFDVESLYGSSFDDSLAGDDRESRLTGFAGNDVIHGRGGNDILVGGDGGDSLNGDEGDDRLIGGLDADQLNGGDGVDTADYRVSEVGVQVNLLTQSGIGGDAEGDTLVSIENLAGSQFDDVLTGNDGVNRLQGFEGDDQLFGAGGNDRLLGGQGSDVNNGGAGVDTADYSTSASGVVVNLKLNTGQGGDAHGDTFVLIENLSGSDFVDTLIGDDLNNRLYGVDGDDALNGLGGIDYLVGGSGNDVMTGDAGADVFVFGRGSGQDAIIDFWAGTGRTDRIQFTDGQFANFSALQASSVNSTSGVVITAGDGSTITLTGVQLSQLTADDFIFA